MHYEWSPASAAPGGIQGYGQLPTILPLILSSLGPAFPVGKRVQLKAAAVSIAGSTVGEAAVASSNRYPNFPENCC